VIRSFNSNKPFDQFAMEQIAATDACQESRSVDCQRLCAAGMSSNEGGTIPEELRVNIARERTEAFGARSWAHGWCAVCHDTKYDPTTQKISMR